jgi:two-component system, chemotaxis family, chemotaxis protein CheY
MKILAIDDSNTIRLLMVKMLRELGYSDLTIASSAEEAIPLAANNQYDLILSDWNLPKMSGLDFVKYLKSYPKTQKIPIIMVTTIHDRSAILKALKAGVQGYILKPIGKEILSAKLHEIEEKIKTVNK